jgi:hypothetical protein
VTRCFANKGIALIMALLAVQVTLFLLSMDAGAFASLSIFCTGPVASRLGLAFGLLHLLFAMLVPLGIASLWFARLRVAYAALLIGTLALLPVQAHLVEQGSMACDGP